MKKQIARFLVLFIEFEWARWVYITVQCMSYYSFPLSVFVVELFGFPSSIDNTIVYLSTVNFEILDIRHNVTSLLFLSMTIQYSIICSCRIVKSTKFVWILCLPRRYYKVILWRELYMSHPLVFVDGQTSGVTYVFT